MQLDIDTQRIVRGSDTGVHDLFAIAGRINVYFHDLRPPVS